MQQRITKKQKDILHFIEHIIGEKGYPPSYREIGHHFNFSSLGSVYRHIHSLEKKGFLQLKKNQPRSLSLSFSNSNSITMEIPLIGLLKGGMPLEFFTEAQLISLPASWIRYKESSYLLKVMGESLREEGIQEGDLILVEARSSALNGETILALVNEQDSLIKRYYQDPPYVRLESSNPEVQPLILRESHMKIQGAVLALHRKFSV